MQINYTMKTNLDITELNMVEVYVNIYNKEYVMMSNTYSVHEFIHELPIISITTDVIKERDLIAPYGVRVQVPLIMETVELVDLINILCDVINENPDEEIEIMFDIIRADNSFLKENVPFEVVLPYLKQGYRACRSGWNGKGMFVVMQKAYPDGIPCNKQTAEVWGLNEGDLFKCNPYFQIKNVDCSHSMWVPSVGDLLANDWFVMNK